MKLLTYEYRGLKRVGVYVGDKIAHLSRLAGVMGRAEADAPSMRALIGRWAELGPALHALLRDAEKKAAELAPILMDPAAVAFLPPIPDPPKNVMCLGLNYKEHEEEGTKAKEFSRAKIEVDHPIFFTKAASTLIGHEADIPKHSCSDHYDYEVELSVIIGDKGINIPEGRAYDHVFGYCCGNDISARDLQRRHKQIYKGKTLDGSGPMGPYIIPKEDFGDPMNVTVKSWVNGELRQNASTATMIHGIPKIISVLSEGLTLEPGDIIMTGTPAGVGYAMDTPSYLQVGDEVVVEVGGLGQLKNKLVAA